MEIVGTSHGMLRDIDESFIQTDYDVHIAIAKIKSYNFIKRSDGYFIGKNAAIKELVGSL